MGQPIDITGQKFGKWTVLRLAQHGNRHANGSLKARRWECLCQCGALKLVTAGSLLQGLSNGCLKCRPQKHGQARTRIYRLCAIAKSRAKRTGIKFDLDWREINVPETCPLLGIPLLWSNKRMHPNNPSLDRIDPTKGYIKENVWVISWRANTIKHNATLDELRRLTDALERAVG